MAWLWFIIALVLSIMFSVKASECSTLTNEAIKAKTKQKSVEAKEISSLLAEREKLFEARATIERNNATIADLLSKLQSSEDEKRKACGKVEQAVKACKERIAVLERQIKDYDEGAKLSSEKISSLTTQWQVAENTIQSLKQQKQDMEAELNTYRAYKAGVETRISIMLSGNLKAFPYLAGMIADYKTYEFDVLAKKLNWGYDTSRAKKVKSILEIRRDANEKIRAAKVAEYQLGYLLELYPALRDIIDENYEDIKEEIAVKDYKDYDPARDYLSKEEWETLPRTEKNQRALDNYVASHSKSKWQIGRDYELFVGYQYTQKGYGVTYFGEMQGLEDLGRDLICTRTGETLIVQCKYWSKEKRIHEKHLFQLFGTTVTYCMEHNISRDKVKPVFVTNIKLSDMAKKVADQLGIQVVENNAMGNFPRIKCNSNGGEYGGEKIYHLPMDQQYDTIDMGKAAASWAMTVAEAEARGYRRAYRWHGPAA